MKRVRWVAPAIVGVLLWGSGFGQVATANVIGPIVIGPTPTPVVPMVTIYYGPAWQQVGGPPGSNFSKAEAMYSWNAATQTYQNVLSSSSSISSAPPSCTGYWAYFAAAMGVTLPAPVTPGATATCTLGSGWNLVGNPFGTPATLPSGVTGFHWNGTSYDMVSVIGTGSSIWVSNPGTLSSLTLTAT